MALMLVWHTRNLVSSACSQGVTTCFKLVFATNHLAASCFLGGSKQRKSLRMRSGL